VDNVLPAQSVHGLPRADANAAAHESPDFSHAATSSTLIAPNRPRLRRRSPVATSMHSVLKRTNSTEQGGFRREAKPQRRSCTVLRLFSPCRQHVRQHQDSDHGERGGDACESGCCAYIYIYIYIYQIVAPLRARVAIVAGLAVPRFPGYRPQGRPDSQKRGRFVFGGGLLAQERRRSNDGGNFIRSHMLLTCR